jgi:hypothetical protein
MTPFNRELGPRLEAVIATSSELRERALLKKVGMAAAMADALRGRGIDPSVAAAAAELGVLAFKDAFEAWTTADNEQPLSELTSAALQRLRSAVTQLG